MNNALKQSEAYEIRIKLAGGVDDIRLHVSHSGRGFNANAAENGGGLGLLSMKERLRLAGGELLIQSRPKHGTEIRARIRLAPRNKSNLLESTARFPACE